MASVINYRPDGSKVEQWDGSAATYTTWDTAGQVTAQRALTASEAAQLAAADAAQTQGNNKATLTARAQAALNANATFQAIGSPSNAQTLAQVQSLTKQTNGIIRLLLGALDSTSGT